jgi:hypothetical protein
VLDQKHLGLKPRTNDATARVLEFPIPWLGILLDRVELYWPNKHMPWKYPLIGLSLGRSKMVLVFWVRDPQG